MGQVGERCTEKQSQSSGRNPPTYPGSRARKMPDFAADWSQASVTCSQKKLKDVSPGIAMRDDCLAQ